MLFKQLKNIFYFVLIGLIFPVQGVMGQRLLQLEIPYQVNAIKFSEGSSITIKVKDFPDDWQTKVIEDLLVDDKVILFSDAMIHLDNITHIRMSNQSAKAAGYLFQGFGSGWLLFGGVAHLAGREKMTWTTFTIGAVSVGLGWFFNKIAGKRTFTMGKNANLRLIDISFPTVGSESK